jgi:hypothetical protein
MRRVTEGGGGGGGGRGGGGGGGGYLYCSSWCLVQANICGLVTGWLVHFLAAAILLVAQVYWHGYTSSSSVLFLWLLVMTCMLLYIVHLGSSKIYTDQGGPGPRLADTELWRLLPVVARDQTVRKTSMKRRFTVGRLKSAQNKAGGWMGLIRQGCDCV